MTPFSTDQNDGFPFQPPDVQNIQARLLTLCQRGGEIHDRSVKALVGMAYRVDRGKYVSIGMNAAGAIDPYRTRTFTQQMHVRTAE